MRLASNGEVHPPPPLLSDLHGVFLGNPSSFVVVFLGQVIKAWDIGVASMKVGELSQLICKPEYAYGSAGSPPKIPPHATLVFEVSVWDIG